MELSLDWRGFQSLFHPRRKAGATTVVDGPHHPVYAIEDDGVIVASQAEGEDLSEWIGQRTEDLAAAMTHRELVIYTRREVDLWISESMQLPHFFEQTLSLREKAVPQVVSKGWFKKEGRKIVLKPRPELKASEHFLLEGILGAWSKVLPTNYGLLIRLEDDTIPSWEEGTTDFLILVRRGKVDSFQTPDLSSMGPERRRRPDDVVKYLSERNLLKVYGLFTTANDWKVWSESDHPWREMASSLRAKRTKLVPFGPGLASLIGSRAMIG